MFSAVKSASFLVVKLIELIFVNPAQLPKLISVTFCILVEVSIFEVSVPLKIVSSQLKVLFSVICPGFNKGISIAAVISQFPPVQLESAE